VKAGQPRTVNHLAVLDKQIVWHRSSYVVQHIEMNSIVLCRKYSAGLPAVNTGKKQG